MSTKDAKSSKRTADSANETDTAVANGDGNGHHDKRATVLAPEDAFQVAIDKHCGVYSMNRQPGESVFYIPVLPRFIRTVESAPNITTATAAATTTTKEDEDIADAEDLAATEAADVADEDDEDGGSGDNDDDDDDDDEDGGNANEDDDDDDDEDDDDADFVDEGDDSDNSSSSSGSEKPSPATVEAVANSASDEEAGGDNNDDRDADVHIAGYAIDPEAPVHLYSSPTLALNSLLQQPRRRRTGQDNYYGVVLSMRLRGDPSAMRLLDFWQSPSAAATHAPSNGHGAAAAAPASSVLAALMGAAEEAEEEPAMAVATSVEGAATAAAAVVDVEEEEDPDTAKVVNGEYIYDEDESLSSSSDDDDGQAGVPPAHCSTPEAFICTVCHYGNGTFAIQNEQELIDAMSEYAPLISGWVSADVDNAPSIRMGWEKVAEWFSSSKGSRITADRVDAYYAHHKLTNNDLYRGVRPALPDIERLDLVRRCLTRKVAQ